MRIKQTKISIINDTKSNQIDRTEGLSDVIHDITQGNHRLLIQQIRQADEAVAKQLKMQLPAFYPCIQLKTARSLVESQHYQSTGIVQFDVDGLNQQEAEILKQDLITHIPELLYAFISPRYGLKCGVLTDFDQCADANTLRIEFKAVYALVEKYLLQHVSCNFDGAVSTISQTCYYSSDPDAHFNPNASVFVVKADAILSVVQEKRKQQAQNLVNLSSYITPDKNDVIDALSYIPTNYNYDKRFRINNAVIDALGSGAEAVLLSHWVHNDMKNIARQIKEQIKTHKKGKITVGTLYKEAQKYGFQFKSNASNQTAIPTTLSPTHNDTIYSVADAKKKLEKFVSDFFDTKQTTLINLEAGAGKTEQVIAEVLKRLRDNPRLKIAFFVPNHKLADEMIKRIYALNNSFIDSQTNFKSMMKAKSSVNVQHIKGKSYIGKEDQLALCKYPSNELGLTSKTKGTSQDKDFIEFYELHSREFCKRCPFMDTCDYIAQFANQMVNIRVYVHNHLLNQPSFFDGIQTSNENKLKQRLESNQKNQIWKPNYIVVDEDLISTAVNDSKLIERVSYDDCVGSDTVNKLMRSIIHEAQNIEDGTKTFEEVIFQHADEILQATQEQNAMLSEWESDYSKPFHSTYDIQEMRTKYSNAKSVKPPHYPMLQKLSYYVHHLQGANDVNECKYERFFFDGNTLCYADLHLIHGQYREIPMLLLDASANKPIAKVFYGQDLIYETVRVEYQSNIKVHQFENNSFSKQQMKNPKLLKRTKKFISKVTKGKTFGIISYMNLPSIKNFDEIFAQEVGADAYGHFCAIRGTNNFKDLDILFVIGRQYMRPDDLEIKYRQLFGFIQESTEPFITDYYMKQQVYRMSDGQHKARASRVYVNNRLEQCHQSFNNSETYQSAHRLRLIHGNELKELYILSNEVLDFTVDELLNTRTDLGYTKTDTDERVEKIIQVIKDDGALYDKNAVIAHEIGEKPSDIANLKSDGEFVDRVLSESYDIEYCKVTGKDKSRRTVERGMFKIKTTSFSKDELCECLNLKKVVSITTV